MSDLSFCDEGDDDEEYTQQLLDRINMDAEYIVELQQEIERLRDLLMV